MLIPGERFDHDAYSLYGSIPFIRAAGFYVVMLQMSITLGEGCVGSTNMAINFLINPQAMVDHLWLNEIYICILVIVKVKLSIKPQLVQSGIKMS